ncbi:MAG: aldo/keto reductase [Candidatus Latescibacteria bacterium]|nr:aldo/keto reductase [Candidatus Latescibacterota bacterium]MBT4137998.1 aldo/keto reductase [Candidatus Latescibacterota bacterium]
MVYGHIEGVDKPISRILQGTSEQEQAEESLLDGVFELGVNAFDSAHVYGHGKSESMVGQWIESRGIRDKVVILTKGAHHSGDRKRVTPFDITSELHDSLARFHTNFIDIYILHRDDPTQEVGPIVEVLNEHKAAGRIGVFGGSNWAISRIQKANEYAYKHNLQPFTVSSPNYTMAEQVKTPWDDCVTISGPKNEDSRAWYAEQKMALFTWSSMAQGFWSGRFTRNTFDAYKSNLLHSCIEAYAYEQNFTRLDRAQELAEEKGVSIPHIALAFIFNQPLNIFSLIGVYHPDECKTNIEALNLKLTQTELDWLDLKREDR